MMSSTASRLHLPLKRCCRPSSGFSFSAHVPRLSQDGNHICRRSSSTKQRLSETPLHSIHVNSNARMTPFAGFSMPLQYQDLTISESHQWTRSNASLFDVGHMVQHRLSGPSASKLLSKITPVSLNSLKPFHSTLSCILLPDSGGIVDDTVITRLGPDSYYMVTNAACRDKDLSFISSEIERHKFEDISWELLDGWGLVALQGPLSAQILEQVLTHSSQSELSRLYFGQCAEFRVDLGAGTVSETILVSRGGYTGEDGFELSIPPGSTSSVVSRLLEIGGNHRLRWAGLAARDSLRLEAGMCLYGHDLDESTTPVEAGLAWLIAQDRRATGDFNGAEIILAQLKSPKSGGTGVSRRRVGLVVEGAPAREGAVVVADGKNEIGKVTSGLPSPTTGKNIAMAYVETGWHKAGTEVGVIVRGRHRKAIVTKMPFVPTKYWRPVEALDSKHPKE